MFNTSELRRGSIINVKVNYDGYLQESKVSVILDDGRIYVEGDSLIINNDDIEGIDLTPENFLRLGGILVDKERNRYQFGLFTFGYSDESGFCLWDDESNSIMFGTVHIQFVHQLQNLIFSLTGMEIKNPS